MFRFSRYHLYNQRLFYIHLSKPHIQSREEEEQMQNNRHGVSYTRLVQSSKCYYITMLYTLPQPKDLCSRLFPFHVIRLLDVFVVHTWELRQIVKELYHSVKHRYNKAVSKPSSNSPDYRDQTKRYTYPAMPLIRTLLAPIHRCVVL